MASPKVSVIIPTYNRLELLKVATQSALDQTFKDYELIISDNHSTDGTQAWARKLTKKNRRITYVRNSKNLGMVANWNAGILKARGKYVTILMDDDFWKPQFLQETSRVLDKETDVGLVCVQVVPHVDVPNPTRKKQLELTYPRSYYRLYKQNKKVKGIDCIKQYLTSQWLVGLPSAVLVRRRCFQEFGLFDKTGLDQEMWLRVCSHYHFYYLDKKLCFWGVRDLPGFTANLTPLETSCRMLITMDKIKDYQYRGQDRKKILLLVRKAKEYRLRCLISQVLFTNLKNLGAVLSVYRLHRPLWLFPYDFLAVAATSFRTL